MKFDFRNINWGNDAAEDDRNLGDYFFEPPRFDKILNGEKRYIIGRKGSGKTAIIQKLKFQFHNDPTAFVFSLSLKEFPKKDFEDLREASRHHKHKYTPIWRFLILLELAKKVVTDNSISNDPLVKNLRELIDDNFGEDLTYQETITTLKSKKKNFAVGIFGNQLAGIAHDGSKENTGKLNYQKVATLIEEIISKVPSKNKYFVFFDELDEGYDSNDEELNLMILALISAIESINQAFLYSSLNFLPILALRSDIFDNLKDNDLNKKHDFILRLKWNSESLKELVNLRIRAQYPQLKKVSHPWRKVVLWNPKMKLSNWDRIISKTLLRPRDVIKYLKLCQESIVMDFKSGNLHMNHILDKEYKYSSWLKSEFKDEIYSFLDIQNYVFDILGRIGYKYFDKVELELNLKQDSKVKQWCVDQNMREQDLIVKLYDYGILGNVNPYDKRESFKYLNEMNWPDWEQITVHQGLWKVLNLGTPRTTLGKYVSINTPILGTLDDYIAVENVPLKIKTEFIKDTNFSIPYISLTVINKAQLNIQENIKIIFRAKLLNENLLESNWGFDFELNNSSKSYERLEDLIYQGGQSTYIKLDANFKIYNTFDDIPNEISFYKDSFENYLKKEIFYIGLYGEISHKIG